MAAPVPPVLRAVCPALAAVILAGAGPPLGAQAPRPTAGLGWLAGCWQGRSGTRLVEEQWLAPRGGALLGMSRTTRGDSLVTFEFMRIAEAGDTLVFAAAPAGQPPAEFRGRAPRDGEVVFENPEHDFPQRISYRRAGADSLVARVEGTRGGAQRAFDFPYVRAACAAAASGAR